MTCLLAAAGLAGCGTWVDSGQTRLLRIHDNHFDPHSISVPAGQPFVLKVEALQTTDLSVAIEELGVKERVPGNFSADWSKRPGRHGSPPRRAAIHVGPLAPGRYTIVCECGGRHSTADLNVE